jgi:hypothetical protein
MLEYGLTVLVAVSAAFFIFFKVRRRGGIVTATKAIAALSFVSLGFVMVSKSPANAGLIMLFGLVLGMVGDIFLDASHVCPEEKAFLPLGMAAFAIEHIAVFCAVTVACGFHILYFGISLAFGAVTALAVLFAVRKKMDFGKLFYPATGYAAVLTATTAYYVTMAVLGGLTVTLAIGAGLFFISDFIILFILFGGKDTAKMNVFNLSTYFAAQVMYAFSLGGLAA